MGQGGDMKLSIRHIKKNPWIKTGTAIASVIAVAVLLLACCMFYTTGSFRGSLKRFVSNVIESYSLSVVQSGSNLIGYLDYNENSVEGNLIVKIFNQVIPLHTYIAHADDIDFKEYVQAARAEIKGDETTQVASNEMGDFLYYNGKVYGDSGSISSYVDANETGAEPDQDAKTSNMITGESYLEDDSTEVMDTTGVVVKKEFYTLEQLSNFSFFIKNCYTVDATTVASESIFDAKTFMKKDFQLGIDKSKPQVLIYHTHSQEAFYDSKSGVVGDSIVGVGDVLTQILEDDYGINVIHDTTTYDLIDGKLDRSLAYSVALPSLQKVLEYNPSIEVVIDLHRDGVGESLDPEVGKRVTTINGEKCAQIMLFNGLSRNVNGPIEWLPNPNLEDNLAFSFQLFLEGKDIYPNLMKPIYLKSYRFNLHLKGRSLLVELGTQYNTVEEAKNSMKYLAELLVTVLTGK